VRIASGTPSSETAGVPEALRIVPIIAKREIVGKGHMSDCRAID